MFTVSTKSGYGLIVMLELAKNYKKDFVSLTDIAKKNKLSANYLLQIVQPLVKAKLIESKEGKGGGYRLVRDPKKISILEILEILEGEVNMVKCLVKDHNKCPAFSVCLAKDIWPVVLKDVRDVLGKRKLGDLV
ncbi:MAG: Rrf2 family transcriptional regulator [Patescibacteria group bacterium]|jgi:Rrf2 family protein